MRAGLRGVHRSARQHQAIAGSETQLAVPNFYFHVATAYAILRHNGVELGKMDYLGSLPIHDA